MTRHDGGWLQGGFTIFEILVAIVIFAVACTTVYGLYGAMVASVADVEGRVVRSGQARAVLERLNLDLIGLYRGKQGYLVGRQTEPRNGEPFLEFLSTSQLIFDPHTVPVPLSRICYYLETDEKGAIMLTRSESPMLSAGFQDPQQERKLVLFIDLIGVEVRFSQGVEVVDEWNSFDGSELERERDTRFPKILDLTLLVAGSEDGNASVQRFSSAVYLRPSLFKAPEG